MYWGTVNVDSTEASLILRTGKQHNHPHPPSSLPVTQVRVKASVDASSNL
jgi:hypothetical protein